jgi:hypothetical protein
MARQRTKSKSCGRPIATYSIPKMKPILDPIVAPSVLRAELEKHGAVPNARVLGDLNNRFGLCSNGTAVNVFNALNGYRLAKSKPAAPAAIVVSFDHYLDCGAAVALLQMQIGGHALAEEIAAQTGFPRKVVNSILKKRLAPAAIVYECQQVFTAHFSAPAYTRLAGPTTNLDPICIEGGRDWIFDHIRAQP